jgi:thioester reductase-like protein
MDTGISSPTIVALTGSTGNFGSYLLDLLIGKFEVKKVVCLNRSRDARSRQLKQNKERGLSTDFAKVDFFQADFGATSWGLGHGMETVLGEVNVVIHNAWVSYLMLHQIRATLTYTSLWISIAALPPSLLIPMVFGL